MGLQWPKVLNSLPRTVSLAQGKGLGRHLVKRLEDLATETKRTMIKLTVLTSNTAARQFYNALGFVLSDDSPDAPGPDAEDCG